MTTVTIKGFVHKGINSVLSDSYTFFTFDGSGRDWVMVGPHEFTYELPADFNPVKAEVDMLDKKIEEITKTHQEQVQQIKERKASLLCIENNPTVSA